MVHVVDVGDGACSVLRPWPDQGLDPATVLDCGVWRDGARTAADRLLTALEGDLSAVESFVVSHFDWDHWGGLRNLMHFPQALGTLNSSVLFYPSMPWRIPAGLLAFMGPQTGTGSAPLDLSNAMQPLLGPGQTLALQPLHTGHGPVTLGGERFDVLWPPQFIDRRFSRRLDGAIAAVEALADDLDEAGYPTLKGNLEAASRGAAALQDEVDADGGAQVDPRADASGDVDIDRNSNDAFDWLDDDDLPWEGDVTQSVVDLQNEDDGGDPDDPDLHRNVEALPTHFKGRYQHVLRRIRAANNDLSLVLASRNARLVAFGDVSGYALREVLKSPRLAGRRFDVMLLPHHGSHPLPRDMPLARWCVAQGGAHHFPRWRANHPVPHTDAKICWNTEVRGSLFPSW